MMMDGPPALPELGTAQPQFVNKETCCLLLYGEDVKIADSADEEILLCMWLVLVIATILLPLHLGHYDCGLSVGCQHNNNNYVDLAVGDREADWQHVF